MADNYAINYVITAVDKFSATMSSMEQKLQANEKTFQAFGKAGKIATGAGLALGAGLAVTVKKAADFESGMSAVAAVSGATGKDFDLLSQAARDWGKSTSFSALEASEGLQYMALAGWDTQQMLGGIGPILHLAEAGALDLGRASDLVTSDCWSVAGKLAA